MIVFSVFLLLLFQATVHCKLILSRISYQQKLIHLQRVSRNMKETLADYRTLDIGLLRSQTAELLSRLFATMNELAETRKRYSEAQINGRSAFVGSHSALLQFLNPPTFQVKMREALGDNADLVRRVKDCEVTNYVSMFESEVSSLTLYQFQTWLGVEFHVPSG